MDKSSMNKPEIETLSYHSPLCKCSECEKNPAKITSQPTDPEYIKLTGYQLTREQPVSAPQEGKEKTTPVIEPKTKVENKESVGQPQQCHNTMTSRECINCEIYAKGKCHLPKPEQPKDNPGPLEKLIVDRIERDLENIAANLEMLKSATKEQNRAKCVLTLEIAHITGEGGMMDDLKGAFK